jgi:hypothetical protein
MALDPKRFDALDLPDLTNLIDAGEREGVGLEYKAELVLSNDEQKKEFLADVSSLANAKGGFLVFGIDEERDKDGHPTGIPAKVIGIKAENIGNELLRLENIARDGIEPRINGLRIKSISISDGVSAIIAYIPLSLVGPHIVKYKGSSRFFSRNSSGKYPLAYSEIRHAFLKSDERVQRIRAFRMDRIAKLIAGEHPADLGGNPLIVVHLLPIGDFTVDAIQAKNLNIEPIYSIGWNSALNFEGALFSSQSHSYIQVFRDGAVEAVSGNLIRKDSNIPSFTYEDEIRKALPRLLDAMMKLEIAYPIAFCYSLLGVKGRQFTVGNNYYHPPSPIPRNDLIIDEILLETSANPDSILKPIFDLVWQACGWPRSINFDQTGKWIPHQ